jgi:predicted ATPase
METILKNVRLRGWKSFGCTAEDVALGPLNVLIGANGAGKSNFISFFRLLEAMATEPGKLQYHVLEAGGASALLHDGAEVTPYVEAALTFENGGAEYAGYEMRLAHAAGDTLFIAGERYRCAAAGFSDWQHLGGGVKETALLDWEQGAQICQRAPGLA